MSDAKFESMLFFFGFLDGVRSTEQTPPALKHFDPCKRLKLSLLSHMSTSTVQFMVLIISF